MMMELVAAYFGTSHTQSSLKSNERRSSFLRWHTTGEPLDTGLAVEVGRLGFPTPNT